MNRLIHHILIMLLLSSCSSRTIIIPSPQNATVMLDGKPLAGNVLDYGRWIGNEYNLQISADGFITQDIKLSPELSDRAGGIAAICIGTLIGIPFLPIVFWNGEINSQVYISLEEIDENR